MKDIREYETHKTLQSLRRVLRLLTLDRAGDEAAEAQFFYSDRVVFIHVNME